MRKARKEMSNLITKTYCYYYLHIVVVSFLSHKYFFKGSKNNVWSFTLCFHVTYQGYYSM